MEAYFIEQVRNREFLRNVKSSLHLRKESAQYARYTNISHRAKKKLNGDRRIVLIYGTVSLNENCTDRSSINSF